MKFLVDANLSPRVVDGLRDEGHDAAHVDDFGLGTADDDAVLSTAHDSDRVLVTADADFGSLLAASGQPSPSVVLLRSADHLTPDQQADLLLANLETLTPELDAGAIVSFSRGRLRVRSLPLSEE
jgi:predicted nuclease of predicted toxin-antitoxin system